MNAGDAELVFRLGEPGTETDILEAGGKAANLSRLVQEGFPVPAGFVVAASAYRQASRNLSGAIRDDLAGGDSGQASRNIAALILGTGLPSEVAALIRTAYRGLVELDAEPPPVAVRSSATAEDLPDLSFAGQQDTYLDVAGEEAVLDAVLRCWASLWTPRAIEYRRRAGINGELPAIAVVVQLMVRAESAGVMFTADPVGGSRSRVVVEAVRGLGDALVSGTAIPERFTLVDDGDAARVAGSAGRGPSAEPILAERELVELARLGRSAESAFGRPQDIEWAKEGGRFFLLQSRPITTLFPLPEDGRPCVLLFSFATWQGYLEPFTPLGRELMLGFVSGAARLFGIRVEPSEQRIFREAGERLWVEVGPLLGWKIGRAFIEGAFSSIDPAAAEIFKTIRAELPLRPQRRGCPSRRYWPSRASLRRSAST